MNNRLGRLIRPSRTIYFALLIVFTLAAAAMQYYLLAAAEALVTIVLFVCFLANKKRRRREILNYIKTVTREIDNVNTAEGPFPLVVLRLNDGDAALVARGVRLVRSERPRGIGRIYIASRDLRAVRSEAYIICLRFTIFRRDDADAALVAGGVASALVERPAGLCLIKTALRVIRQHGMGGFGAYAVGFAARRLEQRLIVVCREGG